jgi:phage shock protein A
MFKQLVTLLRGKSHDAAEALPARNALVILDQQLRDAGAAIRAARRALAMAIAEDQQEAARIAATGSRIAGLEDRTRAALAGGREDLALQAAETIAELEMDRDAAAQAQHTLRAETGRLRAMVHQAERRFAELQRGRRAVRLGNATSANPLSSMDSSALNDAEATLAALQTRQITQANAEAALRELSPAPGQMEDRLAQAGFGPATRPTAAAVLARLKPLAITQS